MDGNTHLEKKTNNESSEESKYELIEILGVNLALKDTTYDASFYR